MNKVSTETSATYHTVPPSDEAALLEILGGHHEAAMKYAKIVIHKKLIDGDYVNCVSDIKNYLLIHLSDSEHEVFGVVWMDNQNKIIAMSDMFRGTVNSSAVYPREVVKEALAHNATSAILYHNHPSGMTIASESDKQITKTLQKAIQLVDVQVLDHIIIGKGGTSSFAERGINIMEKAIHATMGTPCLQR
jgi:DNA repair protein RadC